MVIILIMIVLVTKMHYKIMHKKNIRHLFIYT